MRTLNHTWTTEWCKVAIETKTREYRTYLFKIYTSLDMSCVNCFLDRLEYCRDEVEKMFASSADKVSDMLSNYYASTCGKAFNIITAGIWQYLPKHI